MHYFEYDLTRMYKYMSPLALLGALLGASALGALTRLLMLWQTWRLEIIIWFGFRWEFLA